MSYTPSPSPPGSPSTSDSESESVKRSETSQSTSGNLISTPHPFAASIKATRAPPAYEKKPFTPPTTPPDSKKISSNPREQTRRSDVEADAAKRNIPRSPPFIDDEHERWDTAIAYAIDKAETTIDLSNAGLTFIPASIIDLKGLVVLAHNRCPSSDSSQRPFMRSITAPALLPSTPKRPFLPSHTTNRLEFRAAGQQFEGFKKKGADRNRCEVELYLMRNAIRMLPRELFALDCLVVLSLRQNKLTSLPPAICKLSGLRELNVANNRLSYLPAEIQALNLHSLHVSPNPFEAPPSPSEGEQKQPRLTRILGPLRRGPSVPTLCELALRRLLSPGMPSSHRTPGPTKSCLEASMSLAEIDGLALPPHIKRVIRASTGHGRARVTEEGECVDSELDMSWNACPCPRHYSPPISDTGVMKSVRFAIGTPNQKGLFNRSAPVFRVPVEERIEWVGTVAGVQVAESQSAWVPLLWRGCGPGCLDFLEDEEDSSSNKVDEHTFDAEGYGDEEFQFSDDE
ncbi:hypothetical protein JB92DRAFT_1463500 [Gautieria morchelliformis]|nr:hypothetical protein JB92DRAFT_1463500 [Gautieria morchelliformis]